MNKLKVVEMAIDEVIPYENNPRNNDNAVDPVAESIKEFGFKVPIVIDKNNVIVCGHTRVSAAKQLGLKTVPCVVADDLTDEQVRAFRLADNKTGELASWDFEALQAEMDSAMNIDMTAFGFDEIKKEFDKWNDSRERFDRSREEGNEEYNEFLDKFETLKTSDDCYTPENIYEVVAEYVKEKYSCNRKDFVRPFFPGGDYQNENYKETDVVVDNPPFSILGQIIDFYCARGIKFFLFAPHTSTLGYTTRENVTAICVQASITYENGAVVPTNFLTNMDSDDIVAMSEPDLWKRINEANIENEKRLRKSIPKYDYPDEVVTTSKLGYLSAHGEKMTIARSESKFIRDLECMKDSGKAIFGGGLLISEKAAAEKAAAEKAAAEKAAAEKWILSEREKDIIKSLGEQHRKAVKVG